MFKNLLKELKDNPQIYKIISIATEKTVMPSYKIFIEIKKTENNRYELLYGSKAENSDNIIDPMTMEFDSLRELLDHLSFFIDEKQLAKMLLSNKKNWGIDLNE